MAGRARDGGGPLGLIARRPDDSITVPAPAKPRTSGNGRSIGHSPSRTRASQSPTSADGRLTLEIHEVIPFERAPDALEVVQASHVRGKVVLKIA